MIMTKKNKILLMVLGVLTLILLYFSMQGQEKKEQEIADLYNFEPETLIMEGGYKAAMTYANDIFEELYCNSTNQIYSEVEKELRLEERELLSASYIPGVHSNHLYLLYGIPTVLDHVEMENFKYREYAVIEMNNISRRDMCFFRCSDIQIVTENAKQYYDSAVDYCMKNPSIVLDGNTRNMLDYHVIYNIDEDIAKKIYEYEESRVIAYLLKMQKEGAEAYRWTTSENAAHEKAIGGISEAIIPEETVSSNELSVSESNIVDTDL